MSPTRAVCEACTNSKVVNYQNLPSIPRAPCSPAPGLLPCNFPRRECGLSRPGLGSQRTLLREMEGGHFPRDSTGLMGQ